MSLRVVPPKKAKTTPVPSRRLLRMATTLGEHLHMAAVMVLAVEEFFTKHPEFSAFLPLDITRLRREVCGAQQEVLCWEQRLKRPEPVAQDHADCLQPVRSTSEYKPSVDLEELVDQAGLDTDKPDELDLATGIMRQSPNERYEAMIAVLSGLLERIEGRR